MKKSTLCVHAGHEPEPVTGAVMPPVFFTSTYVQQAPGEHQGYDYSRAGNPSRTVLEKAMAELEGGKHGFCFSSGMGAVDCVLKTLSTGDHVVAMNDLYGGTYRLFRQSYEKLGIGFSFISCSSASEIEAAIQPSTRLMWIETPTNPTLKVVDIELCAQICQRHGIVLVVDNTFASPMLQNPLALGANIVMHSMTKYLGGHSDLIMGGLVSNDDKLAEALFFNQKSTGATPGPMDCYLALRGMKTLHLRMKAHVENAGQVAQFLLSHPKVAKVYYPGLSEHPGHQIAAKQMKGFGGMVSFELKNNSEQMASMFLSNTRLFVLAESLGGVESLASHPASMTHASIPREVRLANGISDGLIRLSVGVEDAEDLLEDLNSALENC
ncbi:MAG: PLP-dependent transferase [Bacteroidetes bacterium]|nr:PLP-dependent transferase [Bacteroidota bacterium]